MSEKHLQMRITVPTELHELYTKFCAEQHYGPQSAEAVVALIREALIAREKAL